MSYMDELKDTLKDNDLIIDGRRIMLTGRLFLLTDAHGIVFETEVPYTSFVKKDGEKVNLEQAKGLDTDYENYIALSVEQLKSKAFTFEKKERPEGSK